MKDLMNRVNPRVAIPPTVQTNSSAAIVGNIIDRQGFESLTYLIALGNLTDADVTAAVTIEHGDDPTLADTAQVAATDIIGTLALAGFKFSDDNVCKKIGYIGSKRYSRITITPTANDAGALPVAVTALLGHATMVPTANPPA